MSDLRAWAVEGRASSKAGGERQFPTWDQHDRFRVFETRRDCRAYIEERWGYLRERPDLRAGPFGWRMPRAVRVTVQREVAP